MELLLYKIYRRIDGYAELYDIVTSKPEADKITDEKNSTAPEGVEYYY